MKGQDIINLEAAHASKISELQKEIAQLRAKIEALSLTNADLAFRLTLGSCLEVTLQ